MGKKEHVALLLITDKPEAEAVEDVVAVLRRDFEQCHLAAEVGAAVELFDRHEPRVVVTVFEEVADGEEAYLALFSGSQRAHSVTHHAILFCEGPKAERAFDACVRGIFNDYAIYRPLYDPWRLRLSIRQALDRMFAAEQPGNLRERFLRMQEGIADLRQFLGRLTDQGFELQASARGVYADLSANLEEQLNELRRQLATSRFEDAVKVLNEERLKAGFDRFRTENIQQELDRARSRMERSADSLVEGTKHTRDQLERCAVALASKSADRRPSVLVVDDDEMCQKLFRTALTAEGFDVHEALDGFRGLRLMAQLKPDAVIMDVHMPKLDGLEAVSKAKSSPTLRTIPILMLTGDASSEVVQQAIREGAADFIVKPVNRATLAQKVRRALNLPPNGGSTERRQHGQDVQVP